MTSLRGQDDLICNGQVPDEITIPVVVNIIHSTDPGGEDYVTDEQVRNQIEILNLD